MSTNKPSSLFLVILALSLLGLESCGSGDAAKANKPPPPKVKLASVQTATIDDSADFVATLQSRRSVTLQPQIAGQVSRIFAKYGDEVPQGKVIIQIDPSIPQASVNSSVAATQAAQADLQNAKATLSSLLAQRDGYISAVNFNRKEYASYSKLAAEGAVSRLTGDDYRNRIETAQSNRDAIDQQIQAQQATIAQKQKAIQQALANTQQQQAQLQNFTISAPFPGTVGDIPVKLGDFVNTSTKLTTITQNQPLEVNISLPLEDAPKVHQGTRVDLLDGQGRVLGASRVFFIAPSVANDTQSVLVKALFDNSKNLLRADQYVKARVIWSQSPGVLVPVTAVSRVAGQNFVFVAQQNSNAQQGQPQFTAQQKPVKLGTIQGNDQQVLEGLNSGEKVVVSGILNLSNGAPIVPES